jgi:LysM repeat protein
MKTKNNPQNVINSYHRRQKMMPYIVGGMAVLLILVGVVILVIWFSGPTAPFSLIPPTSTSTPTLTNTPTPIPPTNTPTITPTVTSTQTPTYTTTPSGPFEYTIQDKDTCWDIAVKYNVNINILLELNNFKGQCPIQPGQKILIPAPGQQLPTATSLPASFRGKIIYIVQSGDTLGSIALKFLSTVDAIKTENKMTTDSIQAGATLTVPVNIATAVPTRVNTSTSIPSTSTFAPTATATTKP